MYHGCVILPAGENGVTLHGSSRTKFPYLNAVDALIVIVVCGTILLAYLRFSEPFRDARSGSGAAEESLSVELCLPPGSEWLLSESLDGSEGRDPRSGVADIRLLRAYRDSDALTRVRAELIVRRDSDGAVYFRGRQLVLGMRLRFDTPEMVVEGLLCRMGAGDEAR